MMLSNTVTTLKFVGSVSLGLLTGLSYTLSTLAIPTLITLPSASTGSKFFSDLRYFSRRQLRILSLVSSGSFLCSFLLSPRGTKHPYLLWTSLCVLGGHGYDTLTQPSDKLVVASKPKEKKASKRTVEQSYDNLADSNSDGMESESSGDDVNGEEIKAQMERFGSSMVIQTVITGTAFVMSLIGIWGDGA